MSKYILGVDGGNSKTDYLLCTDDGTFVDIMRFGTVSHEQFSNNFLDTEIQLKKHLQIFFKKNNIDISDIESAAFGLAGADFENQIKKLKNIVKNIGFKCFDVANDGVLGIKAVSLDGTGLCAIIGTGTVIVGVDKAKNMLQVGGFGSISGDKAGGGYILKQSLIDTYSYFYRNGEYSLFVPEILKILEISDKKYLSQKMVDTSFIYEKMTDVIKAVDFAAINNDKLAIKIFENSGLSTAQAAIGCIKNLDFSETINIIKAGSIWHKLNYKGINNIFESYVNNNHDNINFYTLESPPAVGAILWALELLLKKPVTLNIRKQLLEFLTIEKYETLI